MTRIIAGEFGGRRIAVPPRGTRPTTDRVREAIFSRLQSGGVLDGAVVIDAFAGSGALGLEALSRGAQHTTFVDASGQACRVISANVAAVGADARATVVRDRVAPYLANVGGTFTLAFLDPPYDLPAASLREALALLAPRLAEGATVVLETSSRGAEPPWPDAIAPQAAKAYGSTTVHFATPRAQL